MHLSLNENYLDLIRTSLNSMIYGVKNLPPLGTSDHDFRIDIPKITEQVKNSSSRNFKIANY